MKFKLKTNLDIENPLNRATLMINSSNLKIEHKCISEDGMI